MTIDVASLAFHQRLGRLIDKLGDSALWPALARLLAEVAHFDTWVVMLFRADLPPLMLASHHASSVEALLLADYRCQLYRIDPFYRFSQSEPGAGVYRLDEVAPDSFRDTEYFRRYFIHNVVEDEVQFLQPIKGQGVLSLALGSRRRFQAQEIGALQLFAPWLLPLMQKALQFDHLLLQSLATAPPDRHTRMEDALRQSGRPHLTEREVQVALLVLGGHSTKAVAQQLGISLDTAKAHRRNLYAKLGVTQQAGLFLLFSHLPRQMAEGEAPTATLNPAEPA